MDKELRNKISENKILTHNERAKIISDLESYEDLRTKIDKVIQDIELEKHYLRHENIKLDKMFDKGLDKALEILKRNIECN